MSSRLVLPALCLSLVFTAMAQTDTPAKQPATPVAQRETPPDQKAYSEAAKITDPQKKIDAMEKFKKDFPKSQMLSAADSNILSTLVKKFPKEKGKIRNQAKLMFKGADAKQQGATANQIASALLDGGILLKDAEKYSQTAVASMDQAKYVQEQKESYEKRKQKVPEDADLIKRFKESRATRIATLGRIEVKRGKTEKGRALLEEAYAVNHDAPAVSGTLGELAAKAGQNDKALEYLIPARLSGRAPEGAVAALDAVYKKQHGSLDGLDAMLDASYHNLYPNPVHVEEYKATDKRSDRLVLAEVFTGSGCPPCVGADVAFDAAMEQYTRKDVAVVMYHVHIPRPDPMTNPQTTARSKNYKVSGVPSYAVDGKMVPGGGGGRDNAKDVYKRFDPLIEKDLELPAEAKIKATAAVSGGNVKVSAAVSDVKGESKDLKVQVLLVEKEVRYTGENGIRFHPMVVRAMGGNNGEGFALASGDVEQSFNLDEVSASLKKHLDEYEAGGHRGESFKFIEKKYQINSGNLAVVVFVQDESTKHILQSAYIDLSNGGGSHITTETK